MPGTTKTKGSGSVHGDGDLHQGTEFMVECKTKILIGGISFSRLEVLKARQQALKLNRSPLFVLKNVSDIWATLPYHKLVALMERLVLRCSRCACEDMTYIDSGVDEGEIMCDFYQCRRCEYQQRVY